MGAILSTKQHILTVSAESEKRSLRQSVSQCLPLLLLLIRILVHLMAAKKLACQREGLSERERGGIGGAACFLVINVVK